MRASEISGPDDVITRQELLLDIPGHRQSNFDPFPEVARNDEAAFQKVLNSPPGSPIGVDFEFNTKTLKPSITGIATPTLAVGCKWSKKMGEQLIDAAEAKGFDLVAYSTMGADKPVVEVGIGRKTPLSMWSDGMISHYLNNQDFNKGTGKEEDDPGSLGFMNLWTATSMVKLVPNWKVCWGKVCNWKLCPKHDVFGYCAIDAWGGLVSHLHNYKKITTEHKISPQFYRELMELSELCQYMQDYGVYVDMDYAKKMDADMALKKASLFPLNRDMHGAPIEKDFKWFNPNAPMQGVEFFKEHKIKVASGNKEDIRKALRKRCAILGYEDHNEMQTDPNADLTEGDLALLYWYLYKTEGKGLKAWFNEKHVDMKTWLAHPRFITTGSSMNRLASSNPNFMNIPVRGWGEIVRAAVKAREWEKGWRILKADFGQLELRMCLWYAGVDQSVLGPDAFTWLVEKGEGAFEKSCELFSDGKTPRQLAKSVSHAGDYLEGLKLQDPRDLETNSIKRQIEAGALKVYTKKYEPKLKKDWEFRGKIVTFTGSNLADRMFGSHGWENRKKALEIQEDVYFKNFWFLREWQMKELDFIENRNYAETAVGTFLRLYGTDEEDCKSTVALKGQGTSAIVVQEKQIHYWREKKPMVLQVHDEFDWEIPPEADFSDKQIREMVQPMREMSTRLDGFSAPITVKVGESWNEENMREVEL